MKTATRDNRVHALLSEASRCLANNNSSRAKKLCQDAVAIAPSNADAHMVLADVLASRSETKRARQHYEKAIDRDRHHFGAWLNFGVFLKDLSEFENAVVAFKNAVLIDGKSSLARYNLARAQFDAGHFRDATKAFRSFTRMEPSFAEGFFCLSVAQELSGEFSAAVESCETALKLDPGLAGGHLQMGLLLHVVGQFAAAERFLKQAIELDPSSARGYAALAIANGFGTEEEEREALANIKSELERNAIASGGRTLFLNAAYRICERGGDYDEAFGYLTQANAIRDADIGDKYEKNAELWRQMKGHFSEEVLESWSKPGHPNDQLIFIVGMPRSGTTLVEQIFASHPRAFGAGELSMLDKAVNKTVRALKRAEPYPELFKNLTAEEFLQFADDCLAELPAEAAAYDRVTDKLPFNFVHLGPLSLLFPNAKFIYCRRNAIDTCLSCYTQNFASDVWFAFNLEKLARHYRLHVDLITHWGQVLPGRIHEVHYEHLAADPEPNIRKLLEFADLEWDDACLKFHETEREVNTASMWQVRQPMYTSSVEKWKRYEKHLGPLIEGLGDLAHS